MPTYAIQTIVTDLTGADFSNADLTYANLSGVWSSKRI